MSTTQSPSKGEMRARLITLRRHLQDFRELWQRLDPQFRAQIFDIHKSQGQAINYQWLSLDAKYAARKAREGYGTTPGIRTGQMRDTLDGLTIHMRKDQMFWVLKNRQWANYFQRLLHGVHVRYTWGATEQFEEHLEDTVAKYIEEVMNKFQW